MLKHEQKSCVFNQHKQMSRSAKICLFSSQYVCVFVPAYAQNVCILSGKRDEEWGKEQQCSLKKKKKSLL